MTVYEALKAVMGQVQKIGKDDRNREQNYSFRGVDAVVNNVGPALREHGVLIIPSAEDLTSDHYTTKKGAQMRSVTLRVAWTIYGPDGDSIPAVTVGEAADAGDKAVSKAHAVAWRTLLIEALCIPTGDPDPDATTYDRAAPDDVGVGEVNSAKERVRAAWLTTFGSFDRATASEHYGAWTRGGILADATAPELRRYAAYLASLPPAAAGEDPLSTLSPGASSEGPKQEAAEIVDSPRPLTGLQRKRIFAELNARGKRDAAEQRTFLGERIGRPIESRSDLTFEDAKKIIDWFEGHPTSADTTATSRILNEPEPDQEGPTAALACAIQGCIKPAGHAGVHMDGGARLIRTEPEEGQ